MTMKTAATTMMMLCTVLLIALMTGSNAAATSSFPQHNGSSSEGDDHGDLTPYGDDEITELDILIKEVEWAEAAARKREALHRPNDPTPHWTVHGLFDDLLAVTD